MRPDGSLIRLTTALGGTHHVTVPNHRPLKTGTLLGGVLNPEAAQNGCSVEELLKECGLRALPCSVTEPTPSDGRCALCLWPPGRTPLHCHP